MAQNTTEDFVKETDGTVTRKILTTQTQYDVQIDIDNLKIEKIELQKRIVEIDNRITLLESKKNK